MRYFLATEHAVHMFELPSCFGNVRLHTVFALLLLTCISGCGPRRAGPVDRDLADQTLLRVLDTWQQGGTIDQLRAADPPVIVQDASWENSLALQGYRLVGEGRVEDANLYREVELTVQGESSQPQRQVQVTYVIGTDPVLTVFRAIL